MGLWLPISVAMAQSGEDTDSAENRLEEVIVTGTYIKRSGFSDIGSPIDVIDTDSIRADAAVSKVNDFLRYLPQSVVSNPSGQTAPGGVDNAITYGGAFVDLRGLGSSSTLVLLDGQRQARFPLSESGAVDINSLIPVIAIKRVEVLKDGASGVYGTDAIAGVVNFIPYDDYDGFELRGDYRTETEDWTNEGTTISGIAGSPVGDQFHVMGAFEYFTNTGYLTALNDEVFTIENRRFLASSFGMPGSYYIPQRDAAGALLTPLTDNEVRVPDPDCAQFEAGISQFSGTLPAAFGSDSFVDAPAGLCRIMFTQQYYTPPEDRWSGRAAATGTLWDAVNFKTSFGATYGKTVLAGQHTTPVLAEPTLPGDNPGNPFRAVDANGTPLFAQDANGDGVPDRDINGDGLADTPDPDNPFAGTVIVSGTDPASGIPFNEDVRIRIRPFSTSTSANSTDVEQETFTIRYAMGLDGALSNSWDWRVGYAWSLQRIDRRLPDSILPNLIAGLNCTLTDNNLCYNPLGSSVLVPEGDPRFNTQEVFDLIQTNVHDTYETSTWSVDAIVSGELDLGIPAGPVGVAIGVQMREERLMQDFDSALSAGQVAFWGRFDPDFDASDDTFSTFGELAVPVFDNDYGRLDLSAVVRHESQDKSGLSSTEPKFSVLYHLDVLDARASYAESFLVPSLFQRFGSRSSFAQLFDPLNNPTVQGQFATRIGGADDAGPQSSESFNVGFTVSPTENFSFSLDYWNFDYTDLLVTQSPEAIVNADPTGPNVIRDPITTQILRIDQVFFNAGSLEANGFDFSANYDIPGTGVGDFSISLGGTSFSTYDFQQDAGSPVIDGVGSDNANANQIIVPELRANLRLNWLSPSQNHEINGFVRYISEVDSAFTTDKAESQTPVDVQYTYNGLANGRLRLTGGFINVFDERPNTLFNAVGDFQYLSIQNPLPRQVYFNVAYRFQ